jgi:hypothetical protein
MEAPALASGHRGFGSQSDLAARNALSAFPACQMVFHVIGDLVADRRQLKQLVLHERIVGLVVLRYPQTQGLSPLPSVDAVQCDDCQAITSFGPGSTAAPRAPDGTIGHYPIFSRRS